MSQGQLTPMLKLFLGGQSAWDNHEGTCGPAGIDATGREHFRQTWLRTGKKIWLPTYRRIDIYFFTYVPQNLEVNELDKKLLWRRQFLNPYSAGQ